MIGVVVAVTAAAVGVGTLPLAVLTSAGVYLSFSVALWFFALKRKDAGLAAVGFVGVPFGTIALMPLVALGAVLLNAAVVLSLRRLIGDVPDVRDQVLADAGAPLGTFEFLLLLVFGVAIAPLVEEFVFRGLVFRYLRARWTFLPAAAVSAAAFAVIHLSPRLIPSLFVLGFLFAAVTERYRSLYPAVVVHGLNNALALGILFAGGA